MPHPFFKAKGVYFSIEMFDSMKLLHTIRWFICFLSYYLLQNLVIVSLSWVGVARESLVLYFSLKKKKIIRKSVGIRFCPAIFFCIQREKKYLINDFIRKKIILNYQAGVFALLNQFETQTLPGLMRRMSRKKHTQTLLT